MERQIEIFEQLEKIFELIKNQYKLLLQIDIKKAEWYLKNIYLPAGELCDKAGDFMIKR